MGHRGHTVVCGYEGTAIRVVEELRELGEVVVVVVGDEHCDLAQRARELGIETVVGDYRDAATLRRAGADTAEALAIVNDDDACNLHAALTAQKLKPDLRLAVRMFDTRAGQRLEELFASCRMISTSEVAAPAFAAAARFGNSGQPFSIKGKTLQVREIQPGDAVIARLAGPDDNGKLGRPTDRGRAVGLVDAQADRDGSAPRIGYQSATAGERWGARIASLRQLLDRRLLYTFVFLAAVTAISVSIFWLSSGLSPLDAFYLTVTTVSTVGYGDFTPSKYGGAIEIYTIGLMIVSALVLAVFYALFTDMMVGARLARTLGSHPYPKRGHVVVCGLGSIGYRVVAELVAGGIPCVVVEQDENNRFVHSTRHLKVPVIIGDATSEGVLEHLHLDSALAVITLTSQDMANLQTALAVRAIAPRVRVVLRIFDPDFADLIEQAFSFEVSRSVAGLAAPAFVDALLNRRLLATVQVGSSLLAIRELTIHRHHPLAGRRVGDAEADDLKVLAIGEQWSPPTDRTIEPEDELTVLTAKTGHRSRTPRASARART